LEFYIKNLILFYFYYGIFKSYPNLVKSEFIKNSPLKTKKKPGLSNPAFLSVDSVEEPAPADLAEHGFVLVQGKP
jgi:hypothetical protein